MLRNTLLSLVAVFYYLPVAVHADQHMSGYEVLNQQIQELKNEVKVMRGAIKALQASQPTVTMLMPDIAERFQVMHYAGEAEDWALAAHELEGMKGLVSIMGQVDSVKGSMATGFLAQNFNQLDAAIDHGNLESFDKAVNATLKSCNGCHVASGSPGMKITLDASTSLSMRHSHTLAKSSKTGGSKHMH
ncbi:MAG: hypothetical protein ACI8XC_004531 [Gammaproteobacteria bacterium]|jgi:hypothetical protein